MAKVLNGGSLGERKVVHISGVTVHSMQSSLNDLATIQNFAIQHKVDYVAASQVSCASVGRITNLPSTGEHVMKSAIATKTQITHVAYKTSAHIPAGPVAF
jgi:pyruvate kinase